MGIINIYNSLWKAGSEIAKASSLATVEIVKEKYGNEVGQATENSLYSVGNVAATLSAASGFEMSSWTHSAIKSTAYKTF